MRTLIAMISLIVTLALSACHKKPSPPPKPPATKVAVIPKGTNQQYWKAIEAGASKAAAETGVEVVWKGPVTEGDGPQQAAVVEGAIGDAKAIALAPVDDDALAKPVHEAGEKHVPVVIFDSSLHGEAGRDFAAYVGSNNTHAGALAGGAMVKLLGGKGRIALLRYVKGSASTTEREGGFLEAMKAHADAISVVSADRYAGPVSSDAQQAALNMADTLKGVDAVFCPNESTTVGLILTLRQVGLNGKVKVVGFDGSPQLIEFLKKGDVDVLVVQDPVTIGYEAVKAAAALAKGASVPLSIETAVTVVTKADLDKPEVRKLLGLN